MKVKLISYSQIPKDEGEESLQDLVAYCARVSNQNNTGTNEKLIKQQTLVSICLAIETTRDIARQILRHRSFSFQEFSQRYAVADLNFESREARLQDSKNSIETDDPLLETAWAAKQAGVTEASQRAYKWAIENGIAKEQARAVLPEGMYMNGTLRSWIHYIQLRSGNGTQKEHREVALECAKVIGTIFCLDLGP
jgi:thymidylate synthase (FAD)